MIRKDRATADESEVARVEVRRDRKSTRLNSSHTVISYAVFCLKKEEHTSELQSHSDNVCRLLLQKTATEPQCFKRSILMMSSSPLTITIPSASQRRHTASLRP